MTPVVSTHTNDPDRISRKHGKRYDRATRLRASEKITDGVGTAPLTTTYTYDNAGRLLSTDGPLPGSDDATYTRYDAVGRKIWEIGPKGETGFRPATRTTYRIGDDRPLFANSASASPESDKLFYTCDFDYSGKLDAFEADICGASPGELQYYDFDADDFLDIVEFEFLIEETTG